MAVEIGSPSNRYLFRHPKSPYWFVRIRINGRVLRRSTRTADLEEAGAIRDRWLAESSGVNLEWSGWIRDQLADPKSWTRHTFARMKRRHRQKDGSGACLTLAQFGQVLARCGGRCELSGVELHRPPTGKRSRDPLNISIDRRDCALGYTLANTRVITLALNVAMNHWGEVPVRILARALVAQELLDSIRAHHEKAGSK